MNDANEIDDSEYRTSYIAAIAEHLAKIGSLSEIERAVALVRPTRAIDQWSAFKAIADRLIAEKQYERALAFLAETERSAVQFELDANYDFSQKAVCWSEIGDVYLRLGDTAQARDAWFRAANLARMGLTRQNP